MQGKARPETPDNTDRETSMKKLVKGTFCLALMAILAMSASLALAPEVQARTTCPPCLVPQGGTTWSAYSTCEDYRDPYSPVVFRTYMNKNTGQICRGLTPIADI